LINNEACPLGIRRSGIGAGDSRKGRVVKPDSAIATVSSRSGGSITTSTISGY
jgi:hypothetical protein